MGEAITAFFNFLLKEEKIDIPKVIPYFYGKQ
jgi:hypothetical protein